jgi:hypothetical protein
MQTAEEFLISKLGSVSLDKEYPGNIIIKDLEGFVVIYNRKNNWFYVDYINIWSVFEKQYNMNYTDIQLFITNMMLKHLKWRPSTPPIAKDVRSSSFLKHLKWRPSTPCLSWVR